MPALLTMTSRRPSSLVTSSRNAVKAGRSVTSRRRAMVPPPRDCAVRSAVSRSTSPMATFAPLATSARAVAAPMPRPPPVMATTLPCSERGGDLAMRPNLQIRARRARTGASARRRPGRRSRRPGRASCRPPGRRRSPTAAARRGSRRSSWPGREIAVRRSAVAIRSSRAATMTTRPSSAKAKPPSSWMRRRRPWRSCTSMSGPWAAPRTWRLTASMRSRSSSSDPRGRRDRPGAGYGPRPSHRTPGAARSPRASTHAPPAGPPRP